MWPTSIATWKRRAPAAVRARVALARLAEVGEAGLEVTPRPRLPAGAGRCGWRRRRTGLRAAPRRRRPRRRSRPGRSSPDRPRTPLLISSSVAGRTVVAEHGREPRLVETVVAAHEGENDRAVLGVVTGIAFDVAAGSMPSSSASAVDRRRPRRLDLLRGVEAIGERRAAAGCRVRSRGRRRSRRARTSRGCSRRRRRARGSRSSALPPIIPDSACTARNSIPQRSKTRSYAPSWSRKLRSRPSSSRSKRVGVLHDELANADQPAARTRLVAVLRLEVIQDLRQLPVALDLASRGR